MSKLDPKPDSVRPLLDWQYLNDILTTGLSSGNSENRFAVIRIADYEMSADEIEIEAEEQGYIVSYPSEGYMRFE